MNKDLYLAILSMDSYNRGYGRGLKFDPKDMSVVSNEIGNRIGRAKIVLQDTSEGALAAGFYALAYDMTGVSDFANGELVISYRGTNFSLDPSFFESALWDDITQGWRVAFGSTGFGGSACVQAELAVRRQII